MLLFSLYCILSDSIPPHFSLRRLVCIENRSNLSGHEPRSWFLFYPVDCLLNRDLSVPTVGGTY